MDRSGFELSSAATSTHGVLRLAMMSLCLMYDVPFLGVLKAEDLSNKDLYEVM